MTWGKGHAARLGKSGWQRQRDNQRILARDRRKCYVPGCTRPATIVDHVVNLAQGGPDVDSNKAGMCQPHHDAKTAAEAAKGRAVRSRRRPPEQHPGLTG